MKIVDYHWNGISIVKLLKLISPELSPSQIGFTYANEADLLNVALFGQTAKQWTLENPYKCGNIRDYASINELLVLSNMENYNAILIDQGIEQSLIKQMYQLNSTFLVLLKTKMSWFPCFQRFQDFCSSFPLDSCRRFGSYIINHPVYMTYFIDNPIYYFTKNIIRNPYPVCYHEISGFYCS